MSHLSDFLIFCAGSDTELLKKCAMPEIAKHQSVGATVVFTAFFAMISGGYALSTVFEEITPIIFLALMWGLFIFNLDRYIVSSMVTQNGLWQDIKLAIPRLILAGLLAIVISTPLELKIFENKINLQLAIDAQRIYKEQEESIRKKNNPEREVLKERASEIKQKRKEFKKEEQQLRKRLEKLKSEWKQREISANEQLVGNKQKGIKAGKGPKYIEFRAQADEAKKVYEAEHSRANKFLEKEQDKINLFEDKLDAEKSELYLREKQEIAQIKNERGVYKGLAERYEAFSHLKSGSKAIWYTYFFITLLFIAIETAPVFIKILSGKGTYDKLLEEKNNKIIEDFINPLPSPIQKETEPVIDRWQWQYEETIRQNRKNN